MNYESQARFEGICACSDNNKVYKFDSILLDIKDPLYESTEEVDALFACEEKHVISVLTKSGTFVSIPE